MQGMKRSTPSDDSTQKVSADRMGISLWNLERLAQRSDEPRGSLLTEARLKAGLTQKAFAERIGISLWKLERLEQGIDDPTPYLADLEAHANTRPAERGADRTQPPGPSSAGVATRESFPRLREFAAALNRGRRPRALDRRTRI